jgi:hypothetical protein
MDELVDKQCILQCARSSHGTVGILASVKTERMSGSRLLFELRTSHSLNAFGLASSLSSLLMARYTCHGKQAMIRFWLQSSRLLAAIFSIPIDMGCEEVIAD